MVGQSVGRWVGQLVGLSFGGWSFCRSVGQSKIGGRLSGRWPVSRLVGWSAFGWWSVSWSVGWGWSVGRSVGQSKVGGWLSDRWLVCWSVQVRSLVGLSVSWFWLVCPSVSWLVKGRWLVEWLVVNWLGGQLGICLDGWLAG